MYIILRFLTLDVLLEMKGLSPEIDDFLDDTEDTFISASNGLSPTEAPFQEQPPEATTSANIEQQNSTDKKDTNKLSKQVSWSDTQNMKNESFDTSDESSEEDESSKKSNNFCDKCLSGISCCNCDIGEALDDQVKEKDSKTEDVGDETEGREKDTEPRKFDGVFSDTDDTEGSAERYI